MSRPKLSEAERLRRRKESKKKWRDKQKQGKQATKHPNSWIKQAGAIVNGRDQKNAVGPEAADDTQGVSEGPELPGVSLPGFQPGDNGTPKDGDDSGDRVSDGGTGAVDSSSGDGSGAGKSDQPGGGGSDAKEKVDNKELIKMVAGMYCGALKAATEYANKHGRPGLPDELIAVNYSCMTLILEKQLKDTDVNQEEVAAYICLGSSAWVGANCYFGFKSANPTKKTNDPTPEVKKDAPATANGAAHVNGANGKPPAQQATNLVVRDAPKASGGGVYK